MITTITKTSILVVKIEGTAPTKRNSKNRHEKFRGCSTERHLRQSFYLSTVNQVPRICSSFRGGRRAGIIICTSPVDFCEFRKHLTVESPFRDLKSLGNWFQRSFEAVISSNLWEIDSSSRKIRS